MITKSRLTSLTMALAVVGGSVFISIPGANAQHYVDYPYWVETEYYPGPACGYPYPPPGPCYFGPRAVILIPADCPPGSVCQISYFDPASEEGGAQSPNERDRNDSNRSKDRDTSREIQNDRSERQERGQSFTDLPEIELEYPSQRGSGNVHLDGFKETSEKRIERDLELPPQDGWEFDDSSGKR